MVFSIEIPLEKNALGCLLSNFKVIIQVGRRNKYCEGGQRRRGRAGSLGGSARAARGWSLPLARLRCLKRRHLAKDLAKGFGWEGLPAFC